MKAHPGWSCAWRPVTGATDLATGIDSPVRTPSSHSSSSTSQQAEVGRHEGADAERHHVTGHEVRHRDPARPPVPSDLGLLSDLGAEGRHRHLRPVLVEETQTDAEGDDHGDDHRVGAAPGQPRHQRRPEQKDQDRVSDLAEEDGGGAHLMRPSDVRPELSQPFRHLVGREPVGAAAQAREHLAGERPAASRSSSPDGARAR